MAANTTIYIAAGNYVVSAVTDLEENNIKIQGGFPATATGTSLSGYNPVGNLTTLTKAGGDIFYRMSNVSTSPSIEIKGLNFSGATGTGAVFYGSTFNGTIKLVDLTVKNLLVTRGVIAMFTFNGGSMTLDNCFFGNNSASDDGGVVYYSTGNNSASLIIKNSVFTGNKAASRGGALYLTSINDNYVSINNSSFCSNSSAREGGAIYQTTSKVRITQSLFRNNQAPTGYEGGAILATTADLEVLSSNFFNNAAGSGGAIYHTTSLDKSHANIITGSVFYGNIASTDQSGSGGGAVFVRANSIRYAISDSKFVNNAVTNGNAFGGAIRNYNQETSISNCLFGGNKKGNSSTILGSDLINYDNSGGFTSIENSQLQLASSASYTNQTGSTNVTSYVFGSGNTFNNTVVPNLSISDDCPIAISFDPDSDNDGVPDSIDLDDDNDGILDTVEKGPGSTPLDTDGDGIPDYLDLDSDNDGISDVIEANGTDTNKDGRADGTVSSTGIPASAGSGLTPVDTDGDSIPNYLDLDSDNDGINDVKEANGADTNNDGRADGAINVNGIPSSAGTGGLTPPDSDGDGKPNPYDLDSDNDGITDLKESGNTALVDTNNDGKVDGNVDTDKDGIIGSADGTPTIWGDSNDPAPIDSDGDGVPNVKDLDSDNDGVNDVREAGGTDANGDGRADGAVNATTGIPATAGSGLAPVDTDGDGISNEKDLDSDNDGIPDLKESGIPVVDANNDGKVDGTDPDGDGIVGTADGSPTTWGDTGDPTPLDTDGDGIPNMGDLDSDNDGINDVREGGGTSTDNDNDGRADGPVSATGIPSSAVTNGTHPPRDTDGDGSPDYRDLDSDGDGISDLKESGNTGALEADKDNDGVIDPGDDPDKDGIMTVADGNPNTWGDQNDPQPGNTGPNVTDAPDYINPKSDGTTNDINNTPYAAQDGDGDGKIDNQTDADGDGIPDSIDEKPNTFGGLPDPAGFADLTATILMAQPDFSSQNRSRPFEARIYNISGKDTSGAVTVFFTKPSPKFKIAFTGNTWTVVDNGGYYTLTANTVSIAANFAGFVSIAGTITVDNGVAKGIYNLGVVIGDGSAGETDNTNNSASLTLNVNP